MTKKTKWNVAREKRVSISRRRAMEMATKPRHVSRVVWWGMIANQIMSRYVR